MNKKADLLEIFAILGVALVIICIGLLIGYNVLYAITTGSETITIKEKWVKYHGEEAKYLISSTNGQVFQITDSIIKWRFDSSNLYADIEEGNRCKIKIQGWRFPILSDYKNILEADC